MDINEILKMDPKSECKIHYDGYYDWKHCYHQYKQKSHKLEGKSILVSGVFEKYSRKKLKEIIESQGGKFATSISKKLSFILGGDKMGPSKKEKADKLGILILSEKEFDKKYIDNKSVPLNPNDLPLLDEEYHGDTGEPLYNDKNEEVFDPTQEIEYEFMLRVGWKQVFTSKTFIGLLQKKIKQVIEEEGWDNYDLGEIEWDEITESLEIWGGYSFIDELRHSIGCKDLVDIYSAYDTHHSDLIEDDLLWYTSSQLDEEGGEMTIEEI